MTPRMTRWVWMPLGLVVAAVLGWTLTPHAGAGEYADPMLASLVEGDHPLDKPRDDKSYHDRRKRPSFTDEQLNEAIALLTKLHPDLAEELEARRDSESAEEVGSIIHRHFPRLRHLLQLKETDPPMYELRVEDVRLTLESRRLAQQYSDALHEDDDQHIEQSRDALHALLEEHFEIRQRLRQLELQRLEQRIAALREQIDAREDDRDDVIEQRLQELIGTEEGARW